MASDLTRPAWYVLHTRSRFENVVRDGLAKKSVAVFLPIIFLPIMAFDSSKYTAPATT